MMISISKYLNPQRIFFLSSESRDEALDTMVQSLYDNGVLVDRQKFLDAIIEREKVVSTGVGMGVAVPHAKLPDYDDFFIAIGIAHKGVDWHSIDGAPVRLIFMIGGPDDKQTEYLQILSCLTLAIKDEERRKKILTSHSPEDILKLFKDF